jgi:glycosyltransferase involved in cell wall biosynthesis
MHRVSAIITSFNEADNVVGAINSVSWAQEILLVDSLSTDDTVALAKPLVTRVFQRAYENAASQKNWAIPQATHEWVFILDSDERCTPELAKEIAEILAMPDIEHDAFWIRRRNYYFGRRIRFSGLQRDKVIRLLRRDRCRYAEKQVHSEVEVQGTIGRLRGYIDHESFKSMEHYMAKLDRYATWAASDLLRKGVRPNFFHLKIKPAFRFLKHYILQLGFLDGRVGWTMSRLFAKSVSLRYQKLRALLQESSLISNVES